jgi:hypothetical protein
MGSNPANSNGFLRGIKICSFLQRGSKAVSPMLEDFTAC